MKTLTRDQISALEQTELDDLLGYYDCPGQVHPVYSDSIDEQLKLAQKFNISYEAHYQPYRKEENYFIRLTLLDPYMCFSDYGNTKRLGAELLLHVIQRWVIVV